jgi:hypothetical protein
MNSKARRRSNAFVLRGNFAVRIDHRNQRQQSRYKGRVHGAFEKLKGR